MAAIPAQHTTGHVLAALRVVHDKETPSNVGRCDAHQVVVILNKSSITPAVCTHTHTEDRFYPLHILTPRTRCQRDQVFRCRTA